MAETQTYRLPEMERYLQQKMSRQEMHEFEKALMNDPFLANAMEGFLASDTSIAQQHLSEIETAITAKKQRAKVVTLTTKKTEWWRIAAIILVMVSAGAITYSVVNNSWPPNGSIVSMPPKGTHEKETIKVTEDPLPEIALTPKKDGFKFPVIRANNNGHNFNKKEGITNDKPLAKNANPSDSIITAAVTMPSVADTANSTQPKFSRLSAKNEFKGKVVDNAGEPVAFADIKANNGSILTSSDANGNFTLKAHDSIIEVNPDSPGYAAAKARIKHNKTDNRITLKEDEMSLSETVVSAMANKSNNASTTIRVDTINTAKPIGGWKNFEQYLGDNSDFIDAIQSYQNSKEKLVLNFALNKSGQPTDIRLPQEIDKPVADKITALLRSGPHWKNNRKEKKVKVIILF
ncbi:MAG: carboxypeptidase-like regulatory domain-containing protein [Bacteroidota bacterium]|nr:carboxypeptidase-like regulatory domain-containing protein [Bacteroidota bacterium]